MHYLPRLSILICTFIGASTIVVAEPLMANIPPIFLLAVRFTLAAFCLAILVPRRIFPLTPQAIRAGVVTGAGFGVGCALLYIALSHVSAGKITFLIALEVVIVPVVSWLLYKQRLSKHEKVALVPAVVGLWLITGNAETWFSWWELVALLSALAYTVYTISLSRMHSNAGVVSRTFVSFVTIGAIAFSVSALTEPIRSATWNTASVITVLYLVLVGSIARFLMQAWAQKTVSAAFTAVMFTAEPVFAIALSYTFLGERFTQSQTWGAVIIVVGLLLANYPVAGATKPSSLAEVG